MNSLLKELSEEHRSILEKLEHLRSLTDTHEAVSKNKGALKETLLELRRRLHLHHGKEEKILFPALHRLPRIREGGPRCSLFMTHLMNDNIAQSFIESAPDWVVLPTDPPEMEEIRAENSPLMIPLKEHRGGDIAMQCMLHELDQNPTDEGEFLFLLNRFSRMLRLHIEKEETCLFLIYPGSS
jgi:hemerythrin-like domain-containing protein